MKVLTISQNELKNLSYKLLSMIKKDQISTDIIIGIATGGVYVSSQIQKKLTKENWGGQYYEIKLSRQSTETKKTLKLKRILTKFPYFILNILRKLEVFLFENFKAKEYNSSKENKVHLSNDLINNIKNSNSILLIDDAIDTGSTILSIKNVIKRINPNITIKTAVLTVTHKKPYIEPDYTLFKRVLLRGPWAEDYRGNDKIG